MASAAAAGALLAPDEARNTHLPVCGYSAGDRGFARAPARPRVGLRVATIPKELRVGDTPTWVFTITNGTPWPRRFTFGDSGYGEVELWRGDRRVYRLSQDRVYFQVLWSQVVRQRSSWTCIEEEDDPLVLSPGRYTLVAFLRSGPRPRLRREIVIR